MANKREVLFKANAQMIQNCASKKIGMQAPVLAGSKCYPEVDPENKKCYGDVDPENK